MRRWLRRDVFTRLFQFLYENSHCQIQFSFDFFDWTSFIESWRKNHLSEGKPSRKYVFSIESTVSHQPEEKSFSPFSSYESESTITGKKEKKKLSVCEVDTSLGVLWKREQRKPEHVTSEHEVKFDVIIPNLWLSFRTFIHEPPDQRIVQKYDIIYYRTSSTNDRNRFQVNSRQTE